MSAYTRQVQFYETDLMGIVHHSNYIRYCEEARVFWLRQSGLSELHGKGKQCLFAVLETQVQHLAPLFFEDEFRIELQVKISGVRITFQYRIYCQRQQAPVAVAQTVHATVNDDVKVIKPPKQIIDTIKRSTWTETWL